MYGWSVNVGPTPIEKRPNTLASRGLFGGTLIGCEDGWRPVESISAGDLVWTFDNGLRPVKGVKFHELRPRDDNPDLELVVYRVPSGGLANAEVLVFLPGTGLLLECENASDAQGDPFAVVPVDALEGVCGVRRDTVPGRIVLYTLTFEQEEVFYIDSGLLVHAKAHHADGAAHYDVKSVEAAQEMLTDLDFAELALREADEEFFGEMASERVA